MNNYEYLNYSNDTQCCNDSSFNISKNYSFDNDRVNYIPNNDNSKMQFLNNNMMGIMPYSNDFLEPYQGFIRGNLFANLYDEYKNYKPANINSKNERENLLNQLQQYKFALIELNLYLDVYPNDTNAIKLFNNYRNIEHQICDKYESMYGPLTFDSKDSDKNKWIWINSPWPWEVI